MRCWQSSRQQQIQVYAAGVIYMKTQAEVDQAFDYAKKTR